ncbi:hypothetical protein B0H17DRAFT_1146582 [Mycena rosella]|uniref:Uncharacterized protein n=1 Tax=Mycena rosella TaxID=1033263 RepID=A0AAD7CNJ8_MYCRO|nr:hypothetical protein B0H17DRAFT_1146582 [Mycena rosella]
MPQHLALVLYVVALRRAKLYDWLGRTRINGWGKMRSNYDGGETLQASLTSRHSRCNLHDSQPSSIYYPIWVLCFSTATDGATSMPSDGAALWLPLEFHSSTGTHVENI